jgi:uncharacterized protein (DUF58 family)
MAGSHRSPFRGRGIEFAEVREYHVGDDPRSIDWRVTARTGQLHTKLFHEERERPVLLLVDQSVTMRFGTRCCFKSVLAARLAALLGSAALADGDRIGGVVMDGLRLHPFRALRSRTRWMSMLESIAQASQRQPFQTPDESTAVTLDQAMRRLRSLASPGCQVLLLSDFYRLGEGFETAFRLLAKRTDLHLIHILDPLEQESPPRGIYQISDGTKLAEIDTALSSSQQQWGKPLRKRQQFLKKLCKANQASYQIASTAVAAADFFVSKPRTAQL